MCLEMLRQDQTPAGKLQCILPSIAMIEPKSTGDHAGPPGISELLRPCAELIDAVG